MAVEKQITCVIKPYIQPFEKELALLEIEKILGCDAKSIKTNKNGPSTQFKFISNTSKDELISKLSYWERVIEQSEFVTRQSIRESTVSLASNGIKPKYIPQEFRNNNIKLPNRRCLRYGTHGIHEYRGKFFPQLVKALFNVAELNPKSLIVDPMCGSGTTLVEAALSNHYSFGFDMNPLSVLLTTVKTETLKLSVDELIAYHEKTLKAVSNALSRSNQAQVSERLLKRLGSKNVEYLKRWFDLRILTQLEVINEQIDNLDNDKIGNLFKISLSNIIRRVSWQKNDDLRVRLEKTDSDSIDVEQEFNDELTRSLKLVISLLCEIEKAPIGNATIKREDARNFAALNTNLQGTVDSVITSPPYATALPYIDTDRLSLIFLGLLKRSEQSSLDLLMIGNREISKKIRGQSWKRFCNYKNILPNSVSKLILNIHHLNENSEAGFRRKNLSALLANYFFDMTRVFINTKEILKPNKPAYFVVGGNHTYANGTRIEIETPKLLSEIAESVGLDVERTLNMDMLKSRDIFRGNASSSESVLFLRKRA